MKNIIFLLITLFTYGIGYSQVTFKVIKVNGQIEIIKSGQKLVNGLEFSDKEKLNFVTKTSNAAVINSQKGRMILKADDNDKNEANFLPAMGNISTRGVGIKNLEDLRAHFNGNYVILNAAEIDISLSDYPMNGNNYFFIQYRYNGEEINKKLKSEGNKVIIDKNELFKVDQNPIPIPDSCKMRLYYFKEADKSHLLISEFNLMSPDLESLKKEVQVIIDELKSNTANEKITQVVGYITDSYGKVEDESVKKWLTNNFQL
jgi:hypothetical protein